MSIEQTSTVGLLHLLTNRDARERSWGRQARGSYSKSSDESMLCDIIEALARRIDGKERGPEPRVLENAHSLENQKRPVCTPVDEAHVNEDHDRDQLIDFYDELLAKSAISALSLHDQHLFQDCGLALGLVQCKPETSAGAKARILKAIHANIVKEVKT